MWTKVVHNFSLINYRYHIIFAFLLRLVIIAYGHYHDQHYSVAFTDVDYTVFTDAARHVLNSSSPYNRHTYRYTPVIATLLIPNILLHTCFGKVLFCFIDILVAILIRTIVKHCFTEFNVYRQKSKALSNEVFRNELDPSKDVMEADFSMFFWLYNPLTITIAARGNCDSLACFLVLSTLYFLQCKKCPFYAGLLHGLAIHLRLYPIMYSLSFFMFLSSYSCYSLNYNKNDKLCKKINPALVEDEGGTLLKKQTFNENQETVFKLEYLYYLIPNFEQLKLILGCIFSISSTTTIFYLLYKEKFFYESVLYHLIRKDTRHNFSLYFYLQYLTAGIKHISIWQKFLTVFPQFLLIVVFSVRYGLNRLALNFCVLLQTIVMVSYNTVITSQYFVWILSVLPLCIWQINMSLKFAFVLFMLWFGAQAAWLLPAYLLEFQGQNTFLFIWIQGVSFFCANITILGRLIKYFMVDKLQDKLA